MAGRDRRDAGRRNYDEEDEETHVYCFVPGEGIDVVVLAAYLKRWVDGTATIQPTRHPKVGYNHLTTTNTELYRTQKGSVILWVHRPHSIE